MQAGHSSHAFQNAASSAKQPTIGVLLVHGFNGSRHDLAQLDSELQKRGMITNNMLLPGHGTHVRDMLTLGWHDWAEAVSKEFHEMKQRCDAVFLVGHSLGGALCLHLASHESVAGIVTMCAPLHMYPILKPIIGVVKFITPLLPTIREDVRDHKTRGRNREDVYRWTPMQPIESMLEFLPHLQAELPQVTAPALIMTSIHDHVVPARDGREIYRRIGSAEKYLVTFHRSYHVIMKDHDRVEVLDKTLAFITRHVHTLNGLDTTDANQTT